MYHYGWVREPKAMRLKQQAFSQLYHDDQWIRDNVPNGEDFDYSQVDSLERFTGTHPKVMEDRIRRLNWKFDRDLSKILCSSVKDSSGWPANCWDIV